MRVPWTERRSKQSILKEISPGCSLEGLMLKLNTLTNTLTTWCEELTHWQKILMLGKMWEETGMTEDEMVGWHH